jgi:ATP-binding protein involved in chromosome partitioning
VIAMITEDAVMKELSKVLDPEIGVPITEMKLVDEVKVDANGNVSVVFHGSVPFCPMAAQIGIEIKRAVARMPGVKSVSVRIKDHVDTEGMNRMISEG